MVDRRKTRPDIGLRLSLLEQEKFGSGFGAQAKCSRFLGMDPSSWASLKQGKGVGIDRIMHVADSFGCDVGWLLTGNGEPFPDTAERPVVVQPYDPTLSLGTPENIHAYAREVERRRDAERRAQGMVPKEEPLATPQDTDTADELAEDEDEVAEEAEPVRFADIDLPDPDRPDHFDHPDFEDFVGVPFMAGSAAAGDGMVVEDRPEGVVVMHRRCLPPGHKVTCVRVRGDSMEPLVPDRAIVAIDHDDRDPSAISAHCESRRIVAARLDDETVTIKVLTQAQTQDAWILLPKNPAYTPRLVEPDAIIGRVVWMHVNLLSNGG